MLHPLWESGHTSIAFEWQRIPKLKFSFSIRYGAALTLLLISSLTPATAGDKSVLLIDISARMLNNRLEPTDVMHRFVQFKLKNLETGKTYTRMSQWSRTAYSLRVTPGIYCLYSIYAYINMELVLCDEPYFRVAADTVNNAGRWRIGVSFSPPVGRVLWAMEDHAGLADEARGYFPKIFEMTDQGDKHAQ